MTFWQKLLAMYPDMQGEDPAGKQAKCPSDWGFETRIKGMCIGRTCKDCWGRQVPEQRKGA